MKTRFTTNCKLQRLDYLVKNYLNKNEEDVIREFGKPDKISDREVLFYSKNSYVIFKEEIVFFIENKKVIDIAITEYILGKAVRNIFYLKDEIPEYKILKLF